MVWSGTLDTTLDTVLNTTVGAAAAASGFQRALALAGMSPAGLASLRAAWWTRPTANYDVPYDATHLYDQSGNGRNLLSGASIGTATEGSDTALVFDPGVPNSFTRGDALGLAADPALTLVWKMKPTGPADGSLFPSVISLGTSGTAEVIVFLENTGPGSQQLSVSNYAEDGFCSWQSPNMPDLFDVWRTYTLTKPAASGYANTWRLRVGAGAALVPDVVSPLAIALGSTETLMGDYSGGGYPFDGHLAGMLVFESVLTGADLAVVQGL